MVVPEVLTISEAAMEMRVSAPTVRRWIRDHQLETIVLPSGRRRIPIEALGAMHQPLPKLEHGDSKSRKRRA